jgi:hypothetical protein
VLRSWASLAAAPGSGLLSAPAAYLDPGRDLSLVRACFYAELGCPQADILIHLSGAEPDILARGLGQEIRPATRDAGKLPVTGVTAGHAREAGNDEPVCRGVCHQAIIERSFDSLVAGERM